MPDQYSFEAVWQNIDKNIYSNPDRSQIIHNRRELGGQLFFDRLLSSLGIRKKNDQSSGPESLYPPKVHSDFRKLHNLIATADVQEHWRASAIYYLLRDWKEGREAISDFRHAEDFASRTFLPEKYRICVEGLWHLDHFNFKQSVDCLTHPTLLPTFPEDVLHTLLTHCPRRPESRILPLAYYEAVSPPLTNPSLLDAYFQYLCDLSLPSGLKFLRAQSTTHHQRLLQLLITSALTGQTGEKRARRGVELLELPLTEEEEGWLEEYLLEDEGSHLHGARDTVMMRRIAMGRIGEAEEVGRHLSGRKVDDVSWDDVKMGLARGVGARGNGWGSVFSVEKC